MSYDLYFKAKENGPRPDVDDFLGYFRGRGNYQVSDKQAIYENEATGVYFIFDLGAVEGMEDVTTLPVALNLNYLRPHIFGLEAEPEVKALVEAFDLQVSDPQNGGMGDGDYSSEGFLSGWNLGNQFAYSAILQREPRQSIFTLPTSIIESCWRWNSAKDQLQETFGEEVFVPRLACVDMAGRAVTIAVWPDGIPIAMPQADAVYIQRKQILPRRFFRSSEDIVIADWNAVEPILREFPIEQGALPYRLLKYDAVPEAVASHLRSFPATPERPEAIPVDRILNAELVESALRKTE